MAYFTPRLTGFVGWRYIALTKTTHRRRMIETDSYTISIVVTDPLVPHHRSFLALNLPLKSHISHFQRRVHDDTDASATHISGFCIEAKFFERVCYDNVDRYIYLPLISYPIVLSPVMHSFVTKKVLDAKERLQPNQIRSDRPEKSAYLLDMIGSLLTSSLP